MRKRILSTAADDSCADGDSWLDLERLATVEVDSENPACPIEGALSLAPGLGWQAAAAGPQTIRLIFDEPQRLRRIRLCFREESHERAQEFVLGWSTAMDGPSYQIVRQQYHFSPAGAVEEVEDYRVELENVKTLELMIDPDRGGHAGLRATLRRLQLA
jgi:hypothetical protein